MNPRIATSPDVDSIVRVINDAFRAAESFFVDRDRIDATKIAAMMQAGKFLVNEEGERITACVYVELRGDRAYFGLLAVDPSAQKKGLGRAMIAVVEDYAREAGCRFMDMRLVNLRAELPPFYKRLGYAETSTEPFTADVETKLPCHFINMSKPLV